MRGKNSKPNHASAPVQAIGQGMGKKRKGSPKQNWKGKSHVGSSSNGPKGKSSSNASLVSDPKKAIFFYYNDKWHWK